ncbi:NUDIX domain-containing protein [Corynebacterium sp.]|uniref:NUDIX domain-containing protein n=1 Tax=Corynebacterium sp. TaxID=1720 RepID=UPI0026DFE3FD|nr:NUDIX hydrolase [Corynebacterium sp.]MDO5511695.1 NUDIX hydrolase [Corynebacterium sp.]
MIGDGNGWAAGPGTKVWGRFGAAGLMLLAGHEDPAVLMQHRALWTNNGGTWALPGGARDSHESPREAAVRETLEECSIEPALIEVLHEEVTAGPYPADPQQPELAGDWTYTTVIARTTTGKPLRTFSNEESLELRWVPLSELSQLPLMPAFARSLPGLVQVVDSLDL